MTYPDARRNSFAVANQGEFDEFGHQNAFFEANGRRQGGRVHVTKNERGRKWLDFIAEQLTTQVDAMKMGFRHRSLTFRTCVLLTYLDTFGSRSSPASGRGSRDGRKLTREQHKHLWATPPTLCTVAPARGPGLDSLPCHRWRQAIG